jgi:hypothetical protein
MYSYAYSNGSNHPAGGVPFTQVAMVSGYAADDRFAFHIKNLNHNYAGMVCAPSYVPSSGGQIDAFDPGAANAYMSLVGSPSFFNNFNSNTMMIITEEADDLFGLDSVNTHEDLGFTVVNANPRQDTSASGSYSYTDHAVYAKLALRDFLANKYGCTGSADPSVSGYCGASAAAAALAAFNTAWYGNQIYTTWNTSDSGGLAGLHAGSYASYGTGTGFLDENGAHTLSAAAKSNCNNITANDPWTASPTIKTDLHNYVVSFAQTYAQKLSAAWAQSAVSSHPPIFLPLYDGPSYVYTAVAPYFDGFWIAPSPFTTNNTLGHVQQIIAASSVAGKSMPIIFGDYSSANPDSPFSGSSGGGTLYPSQPAKGAGMVSLWKSVLGQKDVNGKYVVVGVEHWPYYDQVSEGWDGGVATADGDNPYDGSASVATATTSTLWQANHTYTAPSLIYDGTNYQALSGGLTGSCTSGASTPVWGAKMGQSTTDGTCIWRNEGSYTLKPEAGIPNTATLPGKAYGDAITPIANFLSAGICDPGTPPPPPFTSPCDVNGDGMTNVADVQLEVNMALGIGPCTNPSGACTVASVQRVVNAALGGQCVAP